MELLPVNFVSAHIVNVYKLLDCFFIIYRICRHILDGKDRVLFFWLTTKICTVQLSTREVALCKIKNLTSVLKRMDALVFVFFFLKNNLASIYIYTTYKLFLCIASFVISILSFILCFMCNINLSVKCVRKSFGL